MYFVFVYFTLCHFAFGEMENLTTNEFEEDKNSQFVKEVAFSDKRNSANHFTDRLSGVEQTDYPTYSQILQTGFSCKGKLNWHYYADPDTECQIFHICETQYSKISFLCPVGSIFNQRHLVCDWWYNFDCSLAEDLYTLSNCDQTLSIVQEWDDGRGFDLSLVSSRGNTDLFYQMDFSEHPVNILAKNDEKSNERKMSRNENQKL